MEKARSSWVRKGLVLGAGGLLGLALLGLAGGAWLASRQGLPADYWASYPVARVHFDAWGVPTIEAANWLQVTEAQGFVTASERLWQMDLIRRKAGGRLAEWFGEAAYAHDADVQAEDRLAISRADVDFLSVEQRQTCEAYARGVNGFIASAAGRWGIEYTLLRQSPEPWTCADSLLVVLEMAESLTAYADMEAQQMAWRRNLSPAWQDFLFTENHPWNQTLFGLPAPRGPQLPPASEALPSRPLLPSGQGATQARIETDLARFDPAAIGSNSWAWRGPTGAFLASDPHLGLSVPGVWYASRLKVAKDDWLVGASIPGLPLQVLGMNPFLAWAFTNTGEDVDDFLAETLSPDGQRYQALDARGQVEWRPIQQKSFAIKVRGEPAPRILTAQFTHRGPLAVRPNLGKTPYSRQWLPLKAGKLRIPSAAMVMARSLRDFDAAVDGFLAPSQNILCMDGQGGMAYRMSGTGVRRAVSGRWPQPANTGEWLGFEDARERPRWILPAPMLGLRQAGMPAEHLATANARVVMMRFGGAWASDDRRERIDRFLTARENFQRADMEALQLDTQSRFLQLLVRWVAEHADSVAASRGQGAVKLTQWRAWDGSSRSSSRIFTEAAALELRLGQLLLGRVQERFASEDRQVAYTGSSRRAWLTALLEASGDGAMAVFGVSSREVANYLLADSLAYGDTLELHPTANRWQGQHPFVGRLPLLGPLFRVRELPQWGAANLVLAETPKSGPSYRFVWDLQKPWESTWVFPVGQSGHVWSPHYRDWHAVWATDTRVPIFPERDEWTFPGRG